MKSDSVQSKVDQKLKHNLKKKASFVAGASLAKRTLS